MKIEQTIVNIIFDPAKGSVSVASREAASGQPIGALPRPIRPGYAFEGWYLEGAPVTEETVLTATEDVCLVAHWAKKAGDKKVTMYKKQKLAVIVLSVLTVVLIAALLVANHVVAIYGLSDVYYGEDGTEYTEKYYVKKKNGVYGLYSKSGDKMETNDDGYYIAKSGNQYVIDAETGEWELYAVVDYDAAEGESLGFSDRIMMYPQIKQKYVSSIEVTNEYGTYKFYRNDAGQVTIEGTEDDIMTYDATLYASLCVSCGYMLTMQKLDFTSELAPRLPDGSIDYSAYGLSDADSPAIFTITGKHSEGGETVSYSVKVGDAILSGGGYYVQTVGKKSVYIVSADIQDTVLQPVEALVTPMAVYPTSLSQYLLVYDFVLAKAKMNGGTDASALDVIATFTYDDLEARNNTLYNSKAFISLSEMMKGYDINDDNASLVLGNMYEMQFIACKKLGITKESLAEFDMDGDVYYMTYLSAMVDSNGAGLKDEDGQQLYAKNELLISPKTSRGTYYIASFLCDMIVEVDQYYLSFLEWEKSDWYDQYFFGSNLAYVTDFEFTMNGETFTFRMDNTLSYAFYEDSDGEMTLVDLTKGKVVANENGGYTYVDASGVKHEVKLVDFSNEDAFKISGTKIIYTDPDGKQYEMTVGSSNMLIYCDQFTGGKDHANLLDYIIPYTYATDSGGEKTKQISGIDNYRKLYQMFLYASIEGDVDEAEFEKNLGMSKDAYIAQGDGVCQAILKYRVADKASVLNQYTYTDENGKVKERWTEDNEMDVVIRFYRYTERKSLLTIEVIEDYDENGNPISDPTKAVGSFYVLSSYLNDLLDATHRLMNQERVEQ
ncbi:MAG: InlB B-repeat-containing protein [Clostridia bacterium]|nr:InlB B-repeat-containing protein [Clostridia bacterium]